ncbi:MAG TPA: pirin-like C-terminal cupin domain-containing protein [Polyangiaceae bacterium]
MSQFVLERTLGRIRTLPSPSVGQFGPDHTVVEVITPAEWRDADPFILLMDDRVEGRLRAGPHPHAGFETVSFLVHGELGAENQAGGTLSPGDVEWTTAGSGIVHGPDRPIDGSFRLLQLWLTLPKHERWTEPDHQLVPGGSALVRREPGAEVRVYSGTSGAVTSPTRNRVPVNLVDVRLEPGAEVTEVVPAAYNGFLYVIEGEVSVGPDQQRLVPGQIGWLNRVSEGSDTTLRLTNRAAVPLRVLFYAGERQNTPIAWYGPFIGDTRADIARSFERYQAGTFRRI